jgi:hypothetical protein
MMGWRDDVRRPRTGFGGGKDPGHRRLDHRLARSAGLLAAITLLWNPATAAVPALGMLRKGEVVEVTGQWNRGEQIFVATRIERLPKGRHPSARGAIDSLDRSAARFRLFGQEVQVDEATVFVADSGKNQGRFDDLMPGMRVDVSADAAPTSAWKASRVVWRGLKGSDKVKGSITDVGPLADTAQTIQISGLDIRVTEGTDLKSDYLEAELFGTLFSDEGDATDPHLRLGRLRVAGYARMTNYRDADYTLSAADDDSLVGQPALALQVAGDWGSPFQTLVDLRLGSEQSWVGNRFDVTNARLEMLQGYAILRTPGERGATLVVGKQRLRDQREWLFDEYLDAVRLYLTVTRPLVLEASYLPSVFAPPGEKFETWDDLLLRARFIPDSRNEANVYWLKRRDSSPRRRQPVYLGLSYSGRPTRWLRGWLEAALLGGEDKGRQQQAYALDVGTTFSTTGPVRPSLTLAYALGSGEEKLPGDPYSQEFRQTGYEDNTGRFGGVSSFQYYGEVLDPELSNIEVMTAGAGIRFGYSVSVDAVAHVYRQDRPDDVLRAALLLQGAPDGSSRDLGREMDVILGVANLLKCASLSYGFGLFQPGQALDSTDGLATRHRVSLRVGF